MKFHIAFFVTMAGAWADNIIGTSVGSTPYFIGDFS